MYISCRSFSIKPAYLLGTISIIFEIVQVIFQMLVFLT